MSPLTKILFSSVLLLLSVGLVPPAMSGETVTFVSAEIQPTAFKLKRAKAKGITLKPTPGTEFTGVLSKPDGDGPSPAVVILVSGGGQLASHVSWGETLAEWGYVSLLVDSFGSRGGTNFLDTKAIDMTVEGYAAFTYLAGRADVDSENIGLLGFSMGGSFLFPVMRDTNKIRPDNVNYKAAVSFYPTCNLGYDYSAPILVLFGRKDVLSSLKQCQNMIEDSSNKTTGISLKVYDGATHFFDSTDYAKDAALRPGGWSKPMWFEAHNYDAAAHQDSISRTKAFLAEHLK